MFREISLKRFKCFESDTILPLSRFTLLYGKNGRGKSTLAQSLLLLSQSIRATNDLNALQLSGDMISLGTFDDVINRYSETKEFEINLKTESEEIKTTFGPIPDKPKLAKLIGLWADGRDYFDIKSTADGTANNNERSATGISGINGLEKLKNIYYISADRKGPTDFTVRNDNLPKDFLGVKGEYLLNVLETKEESFIEEVQDGLSYILSGASIRVPENKNSEIIELFLDSKNESRGFRPVNVGFGYSYILPILLLALLVPQGSTLIIENPEAHLHPGAQSRLVCYLVSLAKDKNLQIIMETHSDHVINGIRIAVKRSEIDRNEAIIFHFDRNENESDTPIIDSIMIDRNGELSSYPDDFMDEWTKQMLQLV